MHRRTEIASEAEPEIPPGKCRHRHERPARKASGRRERK